MRNLKTILGSNDLIIMYIGNLEAYQGIDLLLDSFKFICQKSVSANLVVIGGETVDIHKYQGRALDLAINQKVFFLGPKPISELADYLHQADILVSPRIKGKNTPMKLYSYLDSGKPILATNLFTHTQLLDSQVSLLAEPYPEQFSNGILRLIEDESLRKLLGKAGKDMITQKFSYTAFSQRLNTLFDWLSNEIEGQEFPIPSSM